MARVRLLDNSPLHQKVEKIFKLMGEEGIKIGFTRYGDCVITSVDNDEEYELQFTDDNEPVRDFPPELEWKLTREK